MRSDIFTVIDDIDIFITPHGGERVEVSRMIFDVEINESIFEAFLTARVTIVDTLDLVKNLPIIGNEAVEIDIHTTDADKSISLDFVLYKIERDRSNMRGDVKRRVLDLHLCSAEAVANGKTSVSRKFTGPAESVVADVVANDLSSGKDLSTDVSSGIVTVYSNYWKPTKIIDFVCRTAKTATYSDYLFYETMDGFSFKALSGLLAGAYVHDLSFSTDSESFIGNKNIRIYKFDTHFDIVRLLRSGAFGTTFYKPHDTGYSYSKTESTMQENLELFTTNGSSRMFDDDLGSALNRVDVNLYEPDISKVRLASIKALESYNLAVRVNGDFGRKCGDNLNVHFPNLDNESTIHELFQGNWLIVGIRHMISQNNVYSQNMLLVKNAFFNHRDLSSISAMINA